MTHALDTRANAKEPYGPPSEAHYADPGYQDDGKKRYPLDSEAHCRAAWSYINQPGNAAMYSPKELATIKKRIRAAGKKYGIAFAPDNDRADTAGSEYRRDVPDMFSRSFDFELRSVGRDGRTLVGTVAVFNRRTRIPDRGGDFEEEILPGFADRSLREHGFPIMQFDHGKDPRVGTVPIGRYDVFGASRTGYDVEGELFDNAVVEPVRQAIQGRAIKGMSFRFHVSKGGDKWEHRNGGMPLRHVIDADVPEAGPVVFPAYRDTKVSLRSILAPYTAEEQVALLEELRAMAGLATDLTGGPTTRSGGRGEPDAQPREGDASPSKTAREIAIRALRSPIAFPVKENSSG